MEILITCGIFLVMKQKGYRDRFELLDDLIQIANNANLKLLIERISRVKFLIY